MAASAGLYTSAAQVQISSYTVSLALAKTSGYSPSANPVRKKSRIPARCSAQAAAGTVQPSAAADSKETSGYSAATAMVRTLAVRRDSWGRLRCC